MYPEYCERVSTSLLAEPLNAFTNIGFFIAWFLITMRKNFATEKKDAVLIAMNIALMLTFIGSSLWHTVRNPISYYLDAIPISIFILLLFYALIRNFLGQLLSIVGLTAFLIVQHIMASWVSDAVLRGSTDYLLALIFFIFLVSIARIKVGSWSSFAIKAIVAFALGLCFRTLDPVLCKNLPIGTHFLWHLFSGLAAYWGYFAATEFRKSLNSVEKFQLGS